ncbi:hypothetical protein QFC21_004058 [Naganishia friedmannii]|uniref:Uncharacterized protein n=1 Tax=Naganishia friedmannii TaxID=89922 RepID=A0ACC2VJ51_9TREE|nr:hypothetical protein QFC21_004058 [Naganishia friedmannii]
MSSSDPIALDDSTFKLDHHHLPTAERNANGGRTTVRRLLANIGLEHQRMHGVHCIAPPAFSPPGFFTDRALPDRSRRIIDVEIVARVGQGYEPPVIPRSATQTSEEARLARDSSLGWSVLGEDDGVSVDGSVSTVEKGRTRDVASGGMHDNSNTSSEDQLQLLSKSDRTLRANMFNCRPTDPRQTAEESYNQPGLPSERCESGEAALEFSDMIDVEMGRPASDAQALTTAQSSNNTLSSKSSIGHTTSRSIEFPRSGPRHHVSQDQTDSLSAYEYVQHESYEDAHATYSASQEDVSSVPVSGIAVSTPLTHFAASSSTFRTADEVALALEMERTIAQTGVRSISRTMVADSSRNRGRDGNDSTPLTVLEVSPATATVRKIRSVDQEMHSTPLSDYAALPPPMRNGRGSDVPASALPVHPVEADLTLEDDASVEYGRGESVSPLEDDLQDLASPRSTPPIRDSQNRHTTSALQDGYPSGDSQDGQSEHMEAVPLTLLDEQAVSDVSLDNNEDEPVTGKDTPESISSRSPDASSIVQSSRLDIRNKRYSKRQSRDEVRGVRAGSSALEERRSRCLKPWGIVEDWNEIDRMELSVEYVV